ncbi:hypothetical protein DFP72DRAFT_854856 [Ephemerocybe angulata]|uniref:Uncharacterized protein n=1 Tax=Ephemerocybe angulata TaxID=980116 RepID=A0A8H6HIK4_9AGAR|nr:hypothetical protein DFP72DRAFT_854856 [Tulosesus angulatus]
MAHRIPSHISLLLLLERIGGHFATAYRTRVGVYSNGKWTHPNPDMMSTSPTPFTLAYQQPALKMSPYVPFQHFGYLPWNFYLMKKAFEIFAHSTPESGPEDASTPAEGGEAPALAATPVITPVEAIETPATPTPSVPITLPHHQPSLDMSPYTPFQCRNGLEVFGHPTSNSAPQNASTPVEATEALALSSTFVTPRKTVKVTGRTGVEPTPSSDNPIECLHGAPKKKARAAKPAPGRGQRQSARLAARAEATQFARTRARN